MITGSTFQTLPEMKVLSGNTLDDIKKTNASVTIQSTKNEKSSYTVTWNSTSNSFDCVKNNKSFVDAVKSAFSHGFLSGNFSTRAACIAKALNQQKHSNPVSAAAFENEQESIDEKTSANAVPTAPPKKEFVYLHEQPLRDGSKKLLQTAFNKSSDAQPFNYIEQDNVIAWKPNDGSLNTAPTNELSNSLPPIIFAYGLSTPRHEMIQTVRPLLSEETATITTIDHYNACLKIDASGLINSFGFRDFLRFFKENSGNNSLSNNFYKKTYAQDLRERFKTLNISPQETKSLIEQHQMSIEGWANYLKNNLDRFIPTRKLTEEKWISFIVKNTNPKALSPNSIFRSCFEKPLEGENLETLKKELEPILNILTKIDSKNLEASVDACDDLYYSLTRDQKELLNQATQLFFFRQTSKLGLGFARSIGAPVLFSWNVEQAKEILDARQLSKASTPQFQTYQGAQVHTTITGSEMAEMSRRAAKGEAPDYILYSASAGAPASSQDPLTLA